MITVMLLKPEWFDGGSAAGATVSAYTVACFFTLAQQQLYLLMSLRTHYELHKHELMVKARPAIERRLIDTLVLYSVAEVSFLMARTFELPSLLYLGLIYFNLMPLYVVYSHKQRMDAALRPQLVPKDEPKKMK